MNEVSCEPRASIGVSQPRDEDIVPDEFQNRLIFWQDKFRQGCFEIGDIAGELLSENAKKKFPVPQSRVFAAVGRFCGRSGRTVRYYYETASFFPPDVRDEFDMLPFSHFVFARTMGDRWREVLEYASLRPHITQEGLQVRFLGVQVSEDLNQEKTPCSPVCDGLEGNQTEVVEAKDSNDGYPKKQAIYRLSSIVESVDMLDKMLDSLTVKDQTRVILRQAIKDIMTCLPEILKAVDVKAE